jgi:ribonucleoside-diphosphate reductase alpha chain
MVERERLPDRWGAELIGFEDNGRQWTATIGRFADGRLGEIFVDAGKEWPLVELAQDSAIVASIALQAVCPLDVLRHALVGRNAGPLGVARGLIGEVAP